MSAMKVWRNRVKEAKGTARTSVDEAILAADRVVRAAKRVTELHYAEGVEDMSAKQLDEYLRKLEAARLTLKKAVEAMEREG